MSDANSVERRFTEEQKLAIEFGGRPLMIVAGAGTGKTSVITEKISRLLGSGVRPEEILALTFTDKAALEMRTRAEEKQPYGYGDFHIFTFHGFAERIIREFGFEGGYPHGFETYSETDSWLLLEKHLDDLPLDYYRPLGNPVKFLSDLARHFSNLEDHMVSPEDFYHYALEKKFDGEGSDLEKKRILEEARCYAKYHELMLKNNAMDFSGTIYFAYQLLKNRPNIRQRVFSRYRAILVDEFQDVNFAQYEFVKLLSGKGEKLTVVGDDDQGIYAFRGASVANILRFKDDFPDAQIVPLTVNFRSFGEILDLAYRVVCHNNPERLETRLGIDKKLSAFRGYATSSVVESPVIFREFSTGREEAIFIAEEILRLREIGGEDFSYDQVAVLVRTKNQAEVLIEEFRRRGLPFERLDEGGLFSEPAPLNCIAFLLAISDPHDPRSIYRLASMPVFSLSDVELSNLFAAARKKSISYFEALSQAASFGLSASSVAKLGLLYSLLSSGQAAQRQKKPTLVLFDFLDKSGYLSYLASGEENSDEELSREAAHLGEFFRVLSEFENRRVDTTVLDFVNYYRLTVEAPEDKKSFSDTVEDTPLSINLITAHKAKGLEYDIVFVPCLSEGRFPQSRRAERGLVFPSELAPLSVEAPGVEEREERRLFYVAATRARDRLYLTRAEIYSEDESVTRPRAYKPSRFLLEAGLVTPKEKEKKSREKTKVLPEKPIEKNRPMFGESARANKVYSYSQISSYSSCPYRYKLEHVIKLPSESSPSLSFGTAIHNALQKFYEKMRVLNSARQDSLFAANLSSSVQSGQIVAPELSELIGFYEQGFRRENFRNEKHYADFFEQGKKILRIFYEAESISWRIPERLEAFFKIKVGSVWLSGRVDRIDKLADNTLEISDYKTGEPKKAEDLSGDKRDQLLIYKLAAETVSELRNLGDVSRLTFWYLNNNTKVSFVGENKEIESMKKRIEDTVSGIEKGDFKPTPSLYNCRSCAYNQVCSFRKLS